MVKKGWGFRDHGTPNSGVSHKWFDELSRLAEWFLCTESDGYPLKLPIFAISGWHCLKKALCQPDFRYFKLKKLEPCMRYQVDFLLSLKLQKIWCYFELWFQKTLGQSVCRISYFWLVGLLNWLLIWLLNCTCFKSISQIYRGQILENVRGITGLEQFLRSRHLLAQS